MWIYPSGRGCFAWGLWNDPGIDSPFLNTCTSNKENAIQGYKRVIDLVALDFDKQNWYSIQNLKEFKNLIIVKNRKSCVKILDAAKQRYQRLVEK